MGQESRVRGKVERPGLAACVLKPGTLVLGGLRILLSLQLRTQTPQVRGLRHARHSCPASGSSALLSARATSPPPHQRVLGSGGTPPRMRQEVWVFFTSPKVISLSQEMKRVLKNSTES